MSDTLPPRYETLELVVPEPPRVVTRRSVVEVTGIVLQTVAWFLIGVLIGYTIATPRGEDRPAGKVVPLLGAPRSDAGHRLGLPASRSTSISGLATWYDVAPGNAAAGPALRAWLGSGWRGTAIRVCHDGCVLTVLTDWCACSDRNGKPTLVDLSRSDFAVIAPLSSGVTTVTVSRAGAIALPATDTAP